MSGQTSQAEILACTKGPVHPQVMQLIEVAGRTCYKSTAQITDESAEEFIRMIIRRGHESVIEHSWVVLAIDKEKLNKHREAKIFSDILLYSQLLHLTVSIDHIFLSGNIRMFRDLFSKMPATNNVWHSVLDELKKRFPLLFEDIDLIDDLSWYSAPVQIIDSEDFVRQYFHQSDKLCHFWAMVRFTGCSRAFTHQLVRHRLMAISQESQRYCDESGFYSTNYFVIPPSIETAGLAQVYIDLIRQMNEWYMEMQQAIRQAHTGKSNEDARFLLPNAVCSEIVVSTNLAEWRHIFKMRCDSHAQWEIRRVMMQLLSQFQKLFPGCFDDLVVADDGLSAKLSKTS